MKTASWKTECSNGKEVVFADIMDPRVFLKACPVFGCQSYEPINLFNSLNCLAGFLENTTDLKFV